MTPDQARLGRLLAELRRERQSLSRVAEEVTDALALFARREPTMLELRGAGDLLHDWYTGLEKLLLAVAVTMDGGAPEGDRWHRRLLDAMSLDLPAVRPPVLSAATVAVVSPYLRFRHLFRHLYGFELDWDQLLPLLRALPAAHLAVSEDLDRFESVLMALSH
jgi:hypothetical protein